ncbi:MAG: hypothetical protein HC835_17135 [Oscillatoriales cyanobacterium RM2_1_1]|nr:hypothetical protein [Oscillatoriales cyanobacterium SM2_3_0]NJO47196.1 hypothetical protein [Oscillatoriales cyanobacterium RM2_1_1]
MKRLVQIAPKALLGCAAVALSSVPAAQAIDINFTFGEGTTLEQRTAFELAGLIWEEYLVDDVEVNLFVDLVGEELLPENVLGGSLPTMTTQSFSGFRSAHQADQTSHRDAMAYNSMPTKDFTSYRTLSNAGNGKSNNLSLTRANSKALGLVKNDDNLDGLIVMNEAFNWNYDFSNGPANNQIDFLSVVLHEIGHSLGFTSVVDTLVSQQQANQLTNDLLGFNLFSSTSVQAHALDLFRYSSDTVGNQRIDLMTDDLVKFLSLDGRNAVYTDGIQVYNNPSDCQNLSSDRSQCRVAEFSTGKGVDGDGYQASHWKQQQFLGTEKTIGIMDPAIGYGMTREITALDLVAFDVIGWDTRQNMRDGIHAGEVSYNLNSLLANAQQQASNPNFADLEDYVDLIEGNTSYYNCILFPWIPGCRGGGGWQELLQANLLTQEVIHNEPEKVPEPATIFGLLGFAALSLVSSRQRWQDK